MMRFAERISFFFFFFVFCMIHTTLPWALYWMFPGSFVCFLLRIEPTTQHIQMISRFRWFLVFGSWFLIFGFPLIRYMTDFLHSLLFW